MRGGVLGFKPVFCVGGEVAIDAGEGGEGGGVKTAECEDLLLGVDVDTYLMEGGTAERGILIPTDVDVALEPARLEVLPL